MKKNVMNEETTLRSLLALFCADVDTFLLRDESQENDKDKLYTKEEIREQLTKTYVKFLSFPKIFTGIHSSAFDVSIFPIINHTCLLNEGFSETYLKSIENQLKNEEL
jgi:hypothetical protein